MDQDWVSLAGSTLAESCRLADRLAPQGGGEFLQRRLERARRVPADKRSADVAAFIESTQLFEDVAQLLPVGVDNTPLLRKSEPTLLRLLVALLKLARAHYVSPEQPVSPIQPRLFVPLYFDYYFPDGFDQAAPEVSSFGELLQMLRIYFLAEFARYEVSTVAWSAVQWQMAQPGFKQAVERQLAALPAACQLATAQQPGASSDPSLPALLQPPSLTLPQLLHALYCRVSSNAHVLLAVQGQPEKAADVGVPAAFAQLPPGRVYELEDTVAEAARTALELEPDNPKGALQAALIQLYGRAQHSVDTFLLACCLAQHCRSDYAEAFAGATAMVPAAMGFDQLSPVTLEAALAACKQAGAALQRCRGLLPDPWANNLVMAQAGAQHFIKPVQLQLQYLKQQEQQQQGRAGAVAGRRRGGSGSGSTRGGGTAGAPALVTLQEVRQSLLAAQAAYEQESAESNKRFSRCDGCSHVSFGLRRCSRCKQAQYCSRECQVEHWGQHKQHCKQAS